MSKTEQRNKLDNALNRFHTQFGYYPFFDGMSEESMLSDAFIHLLNLAVSNNNPEIDLSNFFPEGRNL